MQPTIVIGYDGLDGGDDALALGADLARLTRGRLIAVYVLRHVTGRTADIAQRLLRRPEADDGALELAVQVADATADGLAAVATEHEATAIVVGSSDRGGPGRVLAGGTPERLLHGAPCPIGLAPRGYTAGERGIRTIGVAYDGRPPARAALKVAAEIADRVRAELHVIVVSGAPISMVVPSQLDAEERAAPIDPERDQNDTRLHDVIDRLVAPGATIVPETLEGFPEPLLEARSRGLDLLVLGTRGHGPIGRTLLGSVATHLVHTAHCPLLVVPRGARRVEAAPAGDRPGVYGRRDGV